MTDCSCPPPYAECPHPPPLPIDALHVMPTGDLVEHCPDEDCACGATAQPTMRDDGSSGWVIVHHSLDGREANEP